MRRYASEFKQKESEASPYYLKHDTHHYRFGTMIAVRYVNEECDAGSRRSNVLLLEVNSVPNFAATVTEESPT